MFIQRASQWYFGVERDPEGIPYFSRSGGWLYRHVWRENSPTATWLTDTLDRLGDKFHRLDRPCQYLVVILGTYNHFG